MKKTSRLLGLLLMFLLVLTMMPSTVFAWETETHCEYCGKFIADDWICSGGEHCSEEADGGCYDEHHCSNCAACVDELCDTCDLCADCAVHCLDCGECIDNVDLCEYCGYCDTCAVDNGIHCPDCNVCANSGAVLCRECGRCGTCGGECDEGIESCGICYECHVDNGLICASCKKCFANDDSGICQGCQLCKDCVDEWCDNCESCVDCAIDDKTHCEDCYNCLKDPLNLCPNCEKCRQCAEDNLKWCDECDECLDCAINDHKHCPDCERCFEDVEQCLVCNRCLECGGGMCSDHHTELCMECHIELGKACPQCNKCYGDESEDTAACSECGRCADCVGEDICENCHMCSECAEEQGKHCKNCGRCDADVDVLCANCGLCGDCGGECSNKCSDMCLECHIDSENACPDCGKCYILGAGVGHEGCTECYRCDECTEGICTNCGMCLECAVEQGLHCPNCFECHDNVEFCEECKAVCENCADDWCANCHMCLNCAKDQKDHCPDCGVCDDETDLCPQCGKCEQCSDEWCPDCNKCLECHDDKELCDECGEVCIVAHSPCDAHCEDCFDDLKCPECERCTKCEDLEMCAECGMCVECAADAGTHCPECLKHYNVDVIKCDTCNMCTDCAFEKGIKHCDNDCGSCEKAGDEICPRCGWCKDCMGEDWCDTCKKCLTCHTDDEICKKCGDCFVATEKTSCPDCGLCAECCHENSEEAGCDHDVCIKSDEWTEHWDNEHAEEEHKHVCVWEYNAYQHHKYCIVNDCEYVTDWENHHYGDWTTVVEASETKDGMRSRICLDCGRCDEEVIKATAPDHTHDFGDWITDAMGHYKKCACGVKVDKDVHTAGDWIVDTVATATEDGSKHKECATCHYLMETATIPATGIDHVHNYEIIKFDTDNHWNECECGARDEQSVHSFVWKVDKEATKSETGIKHEECEVCGFKRNENTEIAKLTGSTTNIPQTGDSINISVLLATMFVSGTALMGLAISGKKKESEAE